eukprot:TRINITY_DN20468_c0_g1_i1.p1 TRINITY_DN20468_c0_g1~~TRINITY_DN20468_c0_g1_i1.p1  ORF type:complete len:640 (-),score=168.12 TRINITY_DN20468_c0_g1_i1:403-2274(-)
MMEPLVPTDALQASASHSAAGPRRASAPSAAKIRAGILCFRERAGEPEILLVSRRSRRSESSSSPCDVASANNERYTLPAGKFEAGTDGSIAECAVREAREEAGIECERVSDLGWFESRSKHDELVRTRYFLARCVRELSSWQEEEQRVRTWFGPKEALLSVGYRNDLSAVLGQGLLALPGGADASRSFASASGVDAAALGTVPLGSASTVATTAADDMVALPGDVGSGSELAAAAAPGAEHFSFYDHQVGGHFCLVKPARGMALAVERRLLLDAGAAEAAEAAQGAEVVVEGGDVVLKPFHRDEARFYVGLGREERLAPLRRFTPRCLGRRTLRHDQVQRAASPTASGADTSQELASLLSVKDAFWESKRSFHDVLEYIVLEDIGSGAARPCFMDVKMGCRQRSAKYDQQKRLHMAAKAKRLASGTLGFRICGMQCYDYVTGELRFHDKYWCQDVRPDGMAAVLARFLPLRRGAGTGEGEGAAAALAREAVMNPLLEDLGQLRQTVAALPGLRLWSSSLLLSFDAAAAASTGAAVRVTMIDFAHAADVGGEDADAEYLCGLDNFRTHLEALARCPLEGEDLEGCPSELREWIRERLVPPAPPERQDEEERQAWHALHPEENF